DYLHLLIKHSKYSLNSEENMIYQCWKYIFKDVPVRFLQLVLRKQISVEDSKDLYLALHMFQNQDNCFFIEKKINIQNVSVPERILAPLFSKFLKKIDVKVLFEVNDIAMRNPALAQILADRMTLSSYNESKFKKLIQSVEILMDDA